MRMTTVVHKRLLLHYSGPFSILTLNWVDECLHDNKCVCFFFVFFGLFLLQLSYDLTWQKLKEKFNHCGMSFNAYELCCIDMPENLNITIPNEKNSHERPLVRKNSANQRFCNTTCQPDIINVQAGKNIYTTL